MVDKQQLRSFRQALVQDDRVIDPTDPRYVRNLHGEEADDVVQMLLDEVLMRGSGEIFYFTGQRGTGKSTELRRLEVLLLDEGAQAIRFDSLDYISDTDKITVESLLLLVTAGLADWAKDRYDERFLKSSAWARFTDWLKTEVQIDEVSAYGIKAKLKERQANVVEKVRSLTVPLMWTRTVAAFAGKIVEFIREVSGRDKVVLIVDSLERLRGVSSSDQEDMFRHVLATFAGDFDRLRIPDATVVYSTPPYLALLADVRNYVPLYALASVRVYQKPHGQEHARSPRASGLRAMECLIEKRYPDWREVLAPDALHELALKSGGDLRHFMQRLVSGVVSQTQFALNHVPLSRHHEIVQRVLEENRIETERLTVRSEWSLLHTITCTHKAIAEDREDSLRAMARLFDTRVILNYRNGAEWFDIHPMLWPLIDAYGSERETPAA